MKIEGRIPSRVVLAWCQKNADKVAAIDYVEGQYDVLMAKGWSVDFYGDHLHTIISATAGETLSILKTAERCPIECDYAEAT